MMRTLFEILQILGSIAMIFGAGWFVGMVVSFSLPERVSPWIVVGPLAVSILMMAVGWVLDITFSAGEKSVMAFHLDVAVKREEEESE